MAVLGELNQLRRRGSRWRLRDWRLRTKLTAVLVVPLLLAGVLGTLRVTDALRQARQLDSLERQVSFANQVGATIHDLQRERRLAVQALGDGGDAQRPELQTQGQRVDLETSGLRSPGSGADDLGPQAAGAYRTAMAQIETLPPLRQAVLTGGTNADAALKGYTDAIASLLNLNRAVLEGATDPLDRQATGLAALTVAKEQLSQQHALLLAAIATGRLSAGEQSGLRDADARLGAALDEFGQTVPTGQRTLFAQTVNSGSLAQMQQLLKTALDQALQERSLRIDPVAWDTSATDATARMRQVESSLFQQLRDQTGALGDAAWNAAIRDAAVVAVVLLLAVVLLVVVVRSLLQPLRTLRTAAFEVADERLPDAVESLRITDGAVGERVVDPVPVYSRDEVGQVARAFDTVHLQAVRLAAEQAILRSTVNDIFLNLAGRSQKLVERQLKLIDELEHAEQDSEQLASLFQLDHLATRMRRNSENLLVLAGGTLRSGTEHGIGVQDMLRAAVSEIEEYRRVTVRRPPAATVTGPAVNDLVHLIAELLDNATISAPPDAPVTLSSSLTENGGLLVEITDCGTGLSPTELHEINERLASPPMVDVAVSQHMGLFVVSRLAARHGIRVRLRQQQRDFGITASVLLPPDLVATDQTPTDQVMAPPLASSRPPAPMPTIRPVEPPTIPPYRVGAADSRDGYGRDEYQDEYDAHEYDEYDDEYDEYDDEVADDAAGQVRSGPRGTNAHLPPMQVSVVDSQHHDLFTPTSIGRAPAPEPEPETRRSAVQEWIELFGREEPQQDAAAYRAPPPEQAEEAADQPAEHPGMSPLPRRMPRNRASASGSAASAASSPQSPPEQSPWRNAPSTQADSARTAEPVREQIYDMVSAWFQDQKAMPSSPQSSWAGSDQADQADGAPTPPSGLPRPTAAHAPGAPPAQPAWQSAADEGWHAAEALGAEQDYDMTVAGLPRRRPRAHLVPGTVAAEQPAQPAPSAPGPARTPDDVRGRLNSYQRGLRHGRHARLNPDEHRAAVPQQGSFEEDQQ